MAMVDSSVGGKTGVNHALGKNMIGAFHQPQCVLIDTETLETLPQREHASGISEIVKYGLIRDENLFRWLEESMQLLLARDPQVSLFILFMGYRCAQQRLTFGLMQALSYAVRRSCINKAEIVALDEREGGIRALLNLGHTFGHAMETWQGYGELLSKIVVCPVRGKAMKGEGAGTWLHGEAVAAGMIMAADLSYRLGWIEQGVLERTRCLLQRAQLPVLPPKVSFKTSAADK